MIYSARLQELLIKAYDRQIDSQLDNHDLEGARESKTRRDEAFRLPIGTELPTELPNGSDGDTPAERAAVGLEFFYGLEFAEALTEEQSR